LEGGGGFSSNYSFDCFVDCDGKSSLLETGEEKMMNKSINAVFLMALVFILGFSLLMEWDNISLTGASPLGVEPVEWNRLDREGLGSNLKWVPLVTLFATILGAVYLLRMKNE